MIRQAIGVPSKLPSLKGHDQGIEGKMDACRMPLLQVREDTPSGRGSIATGEAYDAKIQER
jgi:hypothetical protein